METKNLSAGQDLSEGSVNPRDGFPRRRRRSFVGGWAIAAVLALVAVLLYQIRIALLPFVFAVAVAFVLDPLIRALQQRLGSPRWPIAAILYLVVLAILGVAGYRIGITLLRVFGVLCHVSPLSDPQQRPIVKKTGHFLTLFPTTPRTRR